MPRDRQPDGRVTQLTIASGPGWQAVADLDGAVTNNQPTPTGHERLSATRYKGGKAPLLDDPLVLKTILEEVRAGAYLGSAGETAGVSRDTVNGWYRRGREIERAETDPDYEDKYHMFYIMVRQAQGHARGDAEKRVFQARPDMWLMKGPGRGSKDDEESWREDYQPTPQRPVVVTFDIIKASGQIVPPALRDGAIEGEFVDEPAEAED